MLTAHRLLALILTGTLVLLVGGAARASLIIDDFAAPLSAAATVISLNNADPTLIKTVDAGILGGERDLLLDVVGAAAPTSYAGTIGGGTLVFNSSTPGTAATLQYDGVDADLVGPPASLVNAEGLGGIDLTAYGTAFYLDFLSVDGGNAAITTIEIEVHGGGTALFTGTVADSAGAVQFQAPFASFTGSAAALAAATSVTVRINPAGANDVDFQLDTLGIIPEPATLAFVALGGVAMMWMRRK